MAGFQVSINGRFWVSTEVITLQADGARVTDGQGNMGQYIITKFEKAGINLVQAEVGTSIQVIGIDPTSSSFVYTTQNAGPLWNRATTFTGTCE